MSNRVLQQLTGIAAQARQETDCLLGWEASICRPVLHTCEWVLPEEDKTLIDWIRTSERNRRRNEEAELQQNLLICGDNLAVIAALLAGDEVMPSLAGKVELVYCDFLSGCVAAGLHADVAADVSSGAADDAMASSLAMMAPRLMLMYRLLNRQGVIYVRVASRLSTYLKSLCEMIFCEQGLSVLDWLDQGIVLVQPEKPLGKAFYRTMANASADPAALLDDIIRHTIQPNAIVADFFGGRGQTAVIAESAGRRWITSDAGFPACMRLRRQLIERNARPFLYQTLRYCQLGKVHTVD